MPYNIIAVSTQLIKIYEHSTYHRLMSFQTGVFQYRFVANFQILGTSGARVACNGVGVSPPFISSAIYFFICDLQIE